MTEADQNLKTLGQQLKEAREQKGLSIDMVVQRLRLSKELVDALENDDYDSFPAVAYVRGHLQSYAKILGLDPDQMTNEFDRSVSKTAPLLEPFASQPDQQAGSGDKHIKAVTYSLIAALALLLALWWQANRSTPEISLVQKDEFSIQTETLTETGKVEIGLPDEEEIKEDGVLSLPQQGAPEREVEIVVVPEEPKVLEHDYAVVQFADLPTPPDQNPAEDVLIDKQAEDQNVALSNTVTTQDQISTQFDDQRIILQFTNESWAQITDSTGKIRFSRIGNAGEVVSLTGGAPFSVVIGKASVVIMNYQGEIIDLNPLTRGEVARFIIDENGAHR